MLTAPPPFRPKTQHPPLDLAERNPKSGQKGGRLLGLYRLMESITSMEEEGDIKTNHLLLVLPSHFLVIFIEGYLQDCCERLAELVGIVLAVAFWNSVFFQV